MKSRVAKAACDLDFRPRHSVPSQGLTTTAYPIGKGLTDTMTGSILVWTRRLGAVFAMLSTAVPAAAQNVLVRNAPPGAAIEVLLNGGTARSAAADGDGDALVAVGFPSSAEEVDVRLAIDVCAAAVRVYVSSVGAVAPAADAAAGCNRTTLSDRFAMRRVTTFLVEVQATAVSLHLTQGPPPRSWLSEAQGTRAARPFQLPPSAALVASGGLGIGKVGRTIAAACGDMSVVQRRRRLRRGVGGCDRMAEEFSRRPGNPASK